MKRAAWLGVLGGAALACGTAWGQTPAPPQPTYDVTKVADGVYKFRYQGHNSMFIVTPAGVIVTDPISLRRPAAQAYLAEIRKITSAPIKYMIYSHSHLDHSTGGQPFKDAGAIVIAQENAKTRLAAFGPNVVPPDETVRDRRTIVLGGKTLELIYLGRNHSDNMLVMLLPKEKILYTVDWIPVGAPNTQGFEADTNPLGWTAGLRKVLAMDWETLIPGHGETLGTKQDVQKELDWMTDAQAAAKPLADSERCNPAGIASVAMPARYQGWGQPGAWSYALNRYCTLYNQGY